MSFAAAVKTVFKKYASFSGRARRSEYWWFYLFTQLVGIVAAIPYYITFIIFVAQADSTPSDELPPSFFALMASAGLILLIMLPLLIPSIAVTVRRLHDTNRSGWYYLLNFIPFGIGGIVVLVFCILEGTRGDNLYGPDPLAGEYPAAPASPSAA